MRLLLYGVAWADHPDPVASSADPAPERLPVTTITEDDLMVVAGELPDDTQVSDEYAVQHLDALVHLVRGGPVLPLRFGTVAPSADVVRSEVIHAAAESLRHALEVVDDLVELRVDLVFDEEAAIRAVYASDPELRRAVADGRTHRADIAERLEIGQVVADRLAARRAETVEQWLGHLTDLTENATVLPPPEDGTERISLLAHRQQVPAIDREVNRLGQAAAEELRVDYVGPLPATTYSVQVLDEDQQGDAGGAGAPGDVAGSRWGF